MINNDILKLANANQTPFYIFDSDILEERMDNLKKRISPNAELCYAIKANPFLVPLLQNTGILFEVCSPGELSICKSYNVNPAQIVFSGVCKTYDDIKEAYDYKVKTITLESLVHCKYLLDVIKEEKSAHEQEVILRLTSGNQFGMSKDDIQDCFQMLKETPSIKIRGIHYFSGTQKKLNKTIQEVSLIQDYCKELSSGSKINISDIEYGPGLSFNYFEDNKTKPVNDFSEYQDLMLAIKDNSFHWVIELGRYIASSCGTYVTAIKDLKADGEKKYCIIDGGINHINYYGQIMGMKVPFVYQTDSQFECKQNTEVEKYTICGSLCTTADVVLRELSLSAPKPGDYLVFNDIGAYSITEGIYLFLSHPLPAVYIKKGEDFSLVRLPIESSEINFASNINNYK